MEIVASLSQGRTAAAQCGLFTYKSVPVIFEPPCISVNDVLISVACYDFVIIIIIIINSVFQKFSFWNLTERQRTTF